MDDLVWYKKLHWQIGIGLIAGFIIAMIVRALYLVPGHDAGLFAPFWAPLDPAALDTVSSIREPFKFVGDIFIRLLKLLIIPLIFVSLVQGIQKMGDAAGLRRIGFKTILYYITTTFLAVLVGIILVNLFSPGVGLDLPIPGDPDVRPTPLLDVFRNIVPTNVVDAMAKGQMLPTIFAAILFGLAVLIVGERAKPIVVVFDALNDVIFKIVDWVMLTAPVGVMALFVSTLLDPQLADIGSFLENLAGYSGTVLAGLAFHGFVTLPLLLLIFAKRNPRDFARSLAPALMTAFSTASSAATYPVTRECTIEAGVDEVSADFVLPLGATINMDGTALYEAVAAVFIANAFGVSLTFGDQIVIVLTATLAAIGAAGVPSAGLVTMIVVLEAVGLPGAGYGLVVAVDRMLDMCRTTINVWGDAVGAAIVDSGN
jgi:Na+/H+-dicarboxylate symporter